MRKFILPLTSAVILKFIPITIMFMSTKSAGLGVFIIAVCLVAITACNKDKDVTPTPNPNPSPSADTTLKAVASFPIGIAIEYSLFKNNASYKNIVAREADQVTFGYNMKISMSFSKMLGPSLFISWIRQRT